LNFLGEGLTGPVQLGSQGADAGGKFVDGFVGPLGQGGPLKEESNKGGGRGRFVGFKEMVE